MDQPNSPEKLVLSDIRSALDGMIYYKAAIPEEMEDRDDQDLFNVPEVGDFIHHFYRILNLYSDLEEANLPTIDGDSTPEGLVINGFYYLSENLEPISSLSVELQSLELFSRALASGRLKGKFELNSAGQEILERVAKAKPLIMTHLINLTENAKDFVDKSMDLIIEQAKGEIITKPSEQEG